MECLTICAHAILRFAVDFSSTALCYCQSKLTDIAQILQTEKQEKSNKLLTSNFEKEDNKDLFHKGKITVFCRIHENVFSNN